VIFGHIETTHHGRCFRLLVSIRRLKNAVYSTNVRVVTNCRMFRKSPPTPRTNASASALNEKVDMPILDSNSDQVASLRLKKKSERKAPVRKSKAAA